MNCKLIIIFFLPLLLASACSKERDLQKSIFIEDPENTELPKYTEWGYNTFGAYYDRQVFVSNYIETPLKVIVTNNTCTFTFTGQINRTDYYYSGNLMSLNIIIPNYAPSGYQDLIDLHETQLDLTSPGINVSITNNGINQETDLLSGFIFFKRAQNLYVDKIQVETILSGTFELQILINSIPTSITDGRFDIGIGESNFFNY